jgi:hypothetical protein
LGDFKDVNKDGNEENEGAEGAGPGNADVRGMKKTRIWMHNEIGELKAPGKPGPEETQTRGKWEGNGGLFGKMEDLFQAGAKGAEPGKAVLMEIKDLREMEESQEPREPGPET